MEDDKPAQSSIRTVATCQKLEELQFTGHASFRVTDFDHVVSNLAVLTVLKIEVWQQTQFVGLQVLTDNAKVPALRRLQLRFNPINAPTTATAQIELFLSILRSRPGLRGFVLTGIAITTDAFMEDEAGLNWPGNLDELSLEVFVPAEIQTNADLLNRVWVRVYSSIGRMVHLKKLALRSPHLQKSNSAGFPLLGEETKLHTLTLSNAHRPMWTVEELQNLLMVGPNLRVLDLQPISDVHRREINTWLDAQGKNFLRF
ncbi:hypothetical protein BGX33_002930 [Mortierella sp. NVP41]|nr:hypothetical protein BGX33_002930 [Mortierella sp. NVP41]